LSDVLPDSHTLRSSGVDTRSLEEEPLFTEGFLKGLYRRACSIAGHHEDAEDIAQEACLQLWKASRLGKRFEFLAAWTNTVMRNALFGQFRKTRPDLHVSLASDGLPGKDDSDTFDLSDPAHSVVDVMIEAEKEEEQSRLLQLVVQALGNLPRLERDCVMMCARGYSFIQISKALDLDYRAAIRITRRVIADIRVEVEAGRS
jgi:RNA polymerase sigma factor (sigma-70 family)